MKLSEQLKLYSERAKEYKDQLRDAQHYSTELKYELIDLQKEKKLTEAELSWIERSVATLKIIMEDMMKKFEIQKEEKANIIKIRYDNEMKAKKMELEMMAAVLQRRLQQGGTAKTITELDVVTLEGKELKKIPKLLAKIKNAKIVSLANNDLLSAPEIAELKNLQFLNLNRNLIESLDVSLLSKLKFLSVTGNNMKTLSGIHQELTFLDASSNPLGNLNCLDDAKNLSIGLFKTTTLVDTKGLRNSGKLLYLDISENKLTDNSFDNIASHKILQFLQASENQFYNIPDFQNKMLYGFDLSFNIIQTLKINSFLGNLRIIHISNNSIREIQPLTLAPLLRELLIAYNDLRDVAQLYSLSASQYLEILDITGNPIMDDERTRKIIGTLFKNLKFFNRALVQYNIEGKDRGTYTHSNPLKSIKICADAMKYLSYYLPDEDKNFRHEKKCRELIMNLDDVLRDFRKIESNVTGFLGPYFGPYFVYLTGRANAGPDPEKRMLIQERRQIWLSKNMDDAIQSQELNCNPPFEAGIFHYMSKIYKDVDLYAIIATQSRWRMLLQRRKYKIVHKNTVVIQNSYRTYFATKEHKKNLKILKEAKRVQAAIKIQRAYRSWKASFIEDSDNILKNLKREKMSKYPRIAGEKNNARAASRNAASTNEQIDDQDSLQIPEDHEIDEWLRVVVPNKHHREKSMFEKMSENARKLYQDYEIQKDRKNMKRDERIKNAESEASEHNLEVPQNILNHIHGQPIHNFSNLIEQDSNAFFTSGLARLRGQMLQKLTNEFNDAGGPSIFPDGFLTASRYVSKKTNEISLKVATLEAPADASLIFQNIQKPEKLHPERPMYNQPEASISRIVQLQKAYHHDNYLTVPKDPHQCLGPFNSAESIKSLNNIAIDVFSVSTKDDKRRNVTPLSNLSLETGLIPSGYHSNDINSKINGILLEYDDKNRLDNYDDRRKKDHYFRKTEEGSKGNDHGIILEQPLEEDALAELMEEYDFSNDLEAQNVFDLFWHNKHKFSPEEVADVENQLIDYIKSRKSTANERLKDKIENESSQYETNTEDAKLNEWRNKNSSEVDADEQISDGNDEGPRYQRDDEIKIGKLSSIIGINDSEYKPEENETLPRTLAGIIFSAVPSRLGSRIGSRLHSRMGSSFQINTGYNHKGDTLRELPQLLNELTQNKTNHNSHISQKRTNPGNHDHSSEGLFRINRKDAKSSNESIIEKSSSSPQNISSLESSAISGLDDSNAEFYPKKRDRSCSIAESVITLEKSSRRMFHAINFAIKSNKGISRLVSPEWEKKLGKQPTNSTFDEPNEEEYDQMVKDTHNHEQL